MNREVLHIGVKDKGTTRVLSLTGELDSYTSNRLKSISEIWIPGSRRLVVNLDKLDYIDSSGLAALVRMWVMARDNGAEMVLKCRSTRILRILEITGLSNLFVLDGAEKRPSPTVGVPAALTPTNRLGPQPGSTAYANQDYARRT
jgi:anti-sigma B factor antagonist